MRRVVVLASLASLSTAGASAAVASLFLYFCHHRPVNADRRDGHGGVFIWGYCAASQQYRYRVPARGDVGRVPSPSRPLTPGSTVVIEPSPATRPTTPR